MCPHARETARARACVARGCACVAERAFACEAARAASCRQRVRLRTRKSARFLKRALPVAGRVSDSEFDFERDVACVNSPVRHRSRGRVLRASARVGPQGCSRERPRVQQRLHLRTRKNARFWPRALLVAGSMSHRAFNFENEDAWVRSLVGQSVRGRVLHTPAYVWTRERGSACDNIA